MPGLADWPRDYPAASGCCLSCLRTDCTPHCTPVQAAVVAVAALLPLCRHDSTTSPLGFAGHQPSPQSCNRLEPHRAIHGEHSPLCILGTRRFLLDFPACKDSEFHTLRPCDSSSHRTSIDSHGASSCGFLGRFYPSSLGNLGLRIG